MLNYHLIQKYVKHYIILLKQSARAHTDLDQMDKCLI